jgi:hypothetical protein
MVALLAAGAGCALWQKLPAPPSCAAYHAPGFDVNSLCRVLLVPFANESCFPCAAEEIRNALAAELQCLGRFEVVVPPPCPDLSPFQLVHAQGHFDEELCIQAARLYKADAILTGAVTQYRPYPPPHIGLTLQLLRPAEGVVIASVDGLWDARHKELADATREYYREAHLFQPPLNSDLALASPQLFQRFVCHDVVEALMQPIALPPVAPPDNAKDAKNPLVEQLPVPRLLPVSKAGEVQGPQGEQLVMPRRVPLPDTSGTNGPQLDRPPSQPSK